MESTALIQVGTYATFKGAVVPLYIKASDAEAAKQQEFQATQGAKAFLTPYERYCAACEKAGRKPG